MEELQSGMANATYQTLETFIQDVMSMSHIYQPVMLMTLLEHHGTTDKETIARAILNYDQSQVDYYKNIVSQQPGRVLKGHQIVTPGPRGSGRYQLNGFDNLSTEEIQQLLHLCETKLTQYIEKRGERIWAHRHYRRDVVPGSIRYQVLTRAEYRCELCGISAEEKALEVDHIIPMAKGGPDTLENFQALCYTCNAQKRDHDDTDFRDWRNQYAHREPDCIFCELPDTLEVLDENVLALVLKDNFPVSPLHSLVIPKRHVATYFDMNQAEVNACNRLLHERKATILAEDPTVTGFNVGTNAGEDAGQSVFHAHIHLIPRRRGDQDNPRGGVRRIFPDKADY
jgi:diadenosine tetraphosphate (Ap4A) HIT family hydrolase